MKKKELIDLIHDKLTPHANSDMAGKWNKQIIGKWIELALSELISEDGKAKKGAGYNMIIDWFVTTFESVPVLYNELRDEKYSEFPKKPAILPNNRGVVLISEKRSQQYKFVNRENNKASIFGLLEVRAVKKRVTYYIENDKVFYDEHLPEHVNDVLMKLVIFQDLSDNDELRVPAGKELTLANMVFEIIKGKLPEDNKQDQVPKQINS